MLVLLATDDLGSALLYYGIFLAMLYVATARLSFVAAALGLFLVGSFAVYAGRRRTCRSASTCWLDPYKYAHDDRLPDPAVALLDRARRRRRHRPRPRHRHRRSRAPDRPRPEHRLHLLGARPGARADRRGRAAAALHGLRPARLPDRALRDRRILEAARGRAQLQFRVPDVRDRRRHHSGHPADGHHAALRLVRRLERRRQLPARRAAACSSPTAPTGRRRAA